MEQREQPSNRVYVIDGEELEEVPDDEEGLVLADIDDADDGVGEDMEEGEDGYEVEETDDMMLAENEEEEVEDMSSYVFTGHSDAVYCVAIHPTDFTLVATGGGDDKAYLWRTPLDPTLPPPPPLELKGHTDTVTAVDFNFNGQLLLTGAYDGTVRVWKVLDGECVQVLEGPEDVEWAYWHPRGNAVLAGSRDGTIWLWLALTGQCMQVFAGHEGAVAAGAWVGGLDKDKVWVASGGEDGSVRVWAPKTGACRMVWGGGKDGGGHEGGVTCMHSRGELLVTGSLDGTVHLYHAHNNKLLSSYAHAIPQVSESGEEEEVQGVECVALAPPPLTYIATGGSDSMLKIWDYTSTHPTPRCSVAHDGAVVSAQWTAVSEGRRALLVTAALDKVLRVIDGRTGAVLRALTGHTDLIIQMKMSTVKVADEEREMVVTVSDDHTARVFMLDLAQI